MPASPCPSCGGSNLYATRKEISSGGGYAPNLLPGVGGVFSSARIQVVVCTDCGLLRQFASADARRRIRDSSRWTRVV